MKIRCANAIEGSLSLAASQPKDPLLLPMPGAQKYSAGESFCQANGGGYSRRSRAGGAARLRPGDKKGQIAAGIFATGQSQTAMGNSRGLFAAYRETHAEFSITMQEKPAASWAKANSADVRNFDPQKLAARASEKAHLAVEARELPPGDTP